MSAIDFSNLIANKVNDFDLGEVDFNLLSKYKQLIKDDNYFNFVIESDNCGFFYGQALHLYGYSGIHEFHDINIVNSLLQTEYGNIIDGLIAFGQDLFGNQFCFDTSMDNIVFFNSETGEREIITSNYVNWIDILDDRLEYLTGIKVLETWLSNNSFDFGKRLSPKIPFIMGGEYKVNNLYAAKFPDFIKAYANIAKQVFNLPDGTQVKLNVGKK